MNCYVCTKNGTTTESVAVCASCGAGICTSHTHEIRSRAPQSVEAGGQFKTRNLMCDVCFADQSG